MAYHFEEAMPCPGCGKNDKLFREVRMITYHNNRGKCFIVCARCGWRGPEKDDCEKALTAWEKRES